MKKFLAVLISVIIVMMAFAACTPNEPEDHGNETEAPVSATELTTGTAVLRSSSATEYIKLYTAEELSLSQEDYENCSYIVHSTGIEIEGDYYINVAVVNMIPHTDENGKETFTFDTKGDYYIRYDGKRVLKKDLSSDEAKYDEMEVKDIPEELMQEPVTETTQAPTE